MLPLEEFVSIYHVIYYLLYKLSQYNIWSSITYSNILYSDVDLGNLLLPFSYKFKQFTMLQCVIWDTSEICIFDKV